MKGFYPEGWRSPTREGQRCHYTPRALAEAASGNEILEGLAYMCDSDHNLLVDLGSMKGIIPRVEGALGIEEGSVRDIALISRVGKAVCFTVEQICENERGESYALLSRRRAQVRCRVEKISRLNPGDVVDAVVTHLESFGAFCDIGCGNIALLPIDSISVSRIAHPSDRMSAGDKIRVVVKSIDKAGRITLTHKELLGTWAENAQRLTQGQTVSGIVRSVENYGIFVELAPNLAGLAEPREGVKVGQMASVFIKSIIPEKMKIKLIIIDSFESDSRQRWEYFYGADRIERFVYSPEESTKVIETVF